MMAERLSIEKSASDEVKENIPEGLLGAFVGGCAVAAFMFFLGLAKLMSTGLAFAFGIAIVQGYLSKGKKARKKRGY